MPEMTEDKNMERGDPHFFSENVDYCKWFDNQSVTLMFSKIEGITNTSLVL